MMSGEARACSGRHLHSKLFEAVLRHCGIGPRRHRRATTFNPCPSIAPMCVFSSLEVTDDVSHLRAWGGLRGE